MFILKTFAFVERFLSLQIPPCGRNDMVTVLLLVPKFLFWNTVARKFQLQTKRHTLCGLRALCERLNYHIRFFGVLQCPPVFDGMFTQAEAYATDKNPDIKIQMRNYELQMTNYERPFLVHMDEFVEGGRKIRVPAL